MDMVAQLVAPFNEEEYLAGLQTPVFFGSALYNFGVKEVLDMITDFAPAPRPRKIKLFPYGPEADESVIAPSHEKFSGFVFKIQANMDKKHRDRIAFMRVCSGVF